MSSRLAASGRAALPIATPWGRARSLERVTIPQRTSDRRFATIVELLETERGEQVVRFAYTTDGTVRRGPVTLRVRDLERLRHALAGSPGLAALVEMGAA
jgi:hypothetical protein